jgi:hypothetical protein
MAAARGKAFKVHFWHFPQSAYDGYFIITVVY